MDLTDKIFVAGHQGMVGSAIHRALTKRGFTRLLAKPKNDLDLRNQHAVNSFFESEKPAFVFMAAAKVGGILANSRYRADFLFDNLAIQTNIIHASFQFGVKKLLFLGSSCIYPKFADQPIKESALLTGPLEPTNEAYAIAKIAGIKLCQAYRHQHQRNFISAMPTNLYGLNDSYNPENSHVLPALIRRFHEAKTTGKPDVVIWGSGKPLREFLFADDLANACLLLMEHYNDEEIINVGSGEEVSILQVAEHVAEVVGFKGKIELDKSKPDGTPRKLLDSSRIHQLGFKPEVTLRKGIRLAYEDFCKRFTI